MLKIDWTNRPGIPLVFVISFKFLLARPFCTTSRQPRYLSHRHHYPQSVLVKVVATTTQHSYHCQHTEVLHLKHNTLPQQSADKADVAHRLLDVGHGRESLSNGRMKLPENAIRDALIDVVFPISP